MRAVSIALAWVLLSPPAFADIVSPAPESVRVTVYRSPQDTVATYQEDADRLRATAPLPGS